MKEMLEENPYISLMFHLRLFTQGATATDQTPVVPDPTW